METTTMSLRKLIEIGATIDEICRKIDQNIESINEQDCYGCTALHIAYYEGREDVEQLLISKGIDVNIKDKSGKTVQETKVYHAQREKELCEFYEL